MLMKMQHKIFGCAVLCRLPVTTATPEAPLR